ncbi:plasmid replication protein, CyRepA1 family [Okeania sp. SIO2B3]|uniref:plasmid replication protein, CyRepA1 family n=1 Tax=Okeania sp. SIO2B3 TaxID=2607784 RepID=UPI0013BF4E8A|nr:plasmid replication protein, CyRepA1 family [Okeania sp. SIO2B3]NET44874.1 hypothetical protein [Okeania sp. SIO2B3]
MFTHYDLEDGYIRPEGENFRLQPPTKNQHNYSKIYHNNRPGQWIRYNSFSTPCPVCSGERRDCRSKDELYFCRTDNPSKDFKYKGTDEIGFGMYVSLSDRLPHPPSQDINYSQKHQKYSPISDIDRTKGFKKVVKQLGLSTPHRKQLEKRGLTPELIEKYQFKSVDNATKLINLVASGMPLKYGRKFNAKDSSIFIPVWQGNQILGAQLRPKNTSEMKYYWLKAGQATSHLESGEIPLACIIPEEINQVGVGLCESVGFKPIIAAEKLKRVMIGAAGGNFTGGRKQLLQLLNSNHPDKSIPIILYPDAGANENRNVLSQYTNLKHFLGQNGYTLEVAWWEQWQKERDLDIDDYLVSGGDEIKIINWKQYTRNQRIAKGLYKRSRRYKPNIEINERFLPNNIISKYLKPKSIIAVNSAMGTGKTEALKSVLEEHCKDHGLLMLGTRNALLMQSCGRLNIYHLRDDNASLFMNDRLSEIANCFDSLPKWDDENLKDRVIVIDEISSAIPHLLAGATCRRHRSLIQKKLEITLKYAHAIILLDANLKDREVQYIQRISEFNNVIKIKNNYSPVSRSVEFICGSETINDTLDNNVPRLTKNNNEYQPLISELAANKNPYVVAIDGLKKAQQLEAQLINLGVNPDDILRIDSTTIDGAEAKSFMRSPNSYIGQIRPRIIIYTPTIDAGVSIDIKDYFTDIYAFRFHLGTDEFMQMLGRVRDPKCKWHIYSREFVINDADGFSSPFKKRVEKTLTNAITEDAHMNLSIDKKLNRLIPKFKELLTSAQDKHFQAFCELKSARNYEKLNLRETLRDRLIVDGHNVTDIYLESDKTLNQQWKKTNREVIADNVERFLKSENISLGDADDILSKWSSSYEDRLKAEKSILTNRTLPGIRHTSLWGEELLTKILYTDKQLISRLELRWHFQNMDKSSTIQKNYWLKKIKNSEVYLPDWRSPHFVASKLLDTGLRKILENPDREWTGDDKELEAIVKSANHWRRRNYLPKRGKASTIQYINRVLEKIGYTLIVSRRNGKRYYKLFDIYLAISINGKLEALSQPLMQILGQKLDSKAEHCQTQVWGDLEAMTPSDNNIYKSEEVVEAKTSSPGTLEKEKSTGVKIGDLVDVTTPDKEYGMCEVLESNGNTLKVKWGIVNSKILNFSIDLVTKIWRYGPDGLKLIWSV